LTACPKGQLQWCVCFRVQQSRIESDFFLEHPDSPTDAVIPVILSVYPEFYRYVWCAGFVCRRRFFGQKQLLWENHCRKQLLLGWAKGITANQSHADTVRQLSQPVYGVFTLDHQRPYQPRKNASPETEFNRAFHWASGNSPTKKCDLKKRLHFQ
jgi:hypothetical protein